MRRIVKVFLNVSAVLFFDLKAVALYGLSAPKKFQLLYVDPNQVVSRCVTPFRDEIGVTPGELNKCVVGGEWDQPEALPLADRNWYKLVGNIIDRDIDWESGGEMDRIRKLVRDKGVFDGCKNERDIVQRFQTLDEIVAFAKKNKKIKSKREVSPLNYRERGGVSVVVSRNGSLLKSTDGNHRLVIAQKLCLSYIPVTVHAVHPDAINSGAWNMVLQNSNNLRKVQQDS